MKKKDLLEKKAKKFVELSSNKEIKEYAYNWVLFQYKIEELNNFIDKIREKTELEEDLESENGLFSGAKGNNSLELEDSLREYLLKDYM